MTAQIIDLDAEISALLHDVQSADPDAGPHGRSETPIGNATPHNFTDAQWDAWLEGPDDADLPGTPSPATQYNDGEVEVALNHTVGTGHGIYDAVSPDPDFHAATDEVPPQLADTTRLLTDLRGYFADGRSTSAPTDAELQSIANIGSRRDDLGWLDSMLDHRATRPVPHRVPRRTRRGADGVPRGAISTRQSRPPDHPCRHAGADSNDIATAGAADAADRRRPTQLRCIQTLNEHSPFDANQHVNTTDTGGFNYCDMALNSPSLPQITACHFMIRSAYWPF